LAKTLHKKTPWGRGVWGEPQWFSPF
jgi:hypothetical protein